ncbi:ABC transporter ATP-binding protein [Candidatus Woesearchaeota archaeon]|nr:ABC transporter ATP-binding protein [Candidatus Woesearchaeota archaeon]
MVIVGSVEGYISSALGRMPRADLEQVLLRSGWPKSIVQKYLRQEPNVLEKSDGILAISNLTKSFNKKKVLTNVNLVVNKKDLIGVVGVTGSGKTTLLHIIAGILPPSGGTVHTHSSIGIAPQQPALHEHLTARENLEHYADQFNVNNKGRVLELLKLVKLFDDHDTRVEDFSSGMKKRLDIACAIIHEPELLILDEPLADIDPLARQYLWDLLKKINASGTTILLTSHLVDELSAHCSRIAVLKGGQLLDFGPVDDLSNVYTSHYEVRLQVKNILSASVILQKISKDLFTNHFDKDGVTIITTQKPLSLAQSIISISEHDNFVINLLSVQHPTLSEVFEEVVK